MRLTIQEDIDLLAHEVAHTMQNSGAASARRNKLEVSNPGDAAEVEADRVVDLMVARSQLQLMRMRMRSGRKPLVGFR